MRLFLFLFVTIVTLSFPWWVALGAVFSYALWYRAYEAILLGVVIDAIFGVQSVTFGYRYTLMFGTVVFLLELLKPHLSLYNAE